MVFHLVFGSEVGIATSILQTTKPKCWGLSKFRLARILIHMVPKSMYVYNTMFLTLSVAPFQFFPYDDTNQIPPYCLHSLYTTKELEGALEIIWLNIRSQMSL